MANAVSVNVAGRGCASEKPTDRPQQMVGEQGDDHAAADSRDRYIGRIAVRPTVVSDRLIPCFEFLHDPAASPES
ncbi:hypothetical protein D3C71_1658720 [compost metagenome]